MLGAICGDVIGSPYEFGGMKNYDFNLFDADSKLTDDSFMTAAVAAAIMESNNLDDLDQRCAKHYRIFVRNHLDAGYGGMFKKWALSDDIEYRKSWGNGSAMRVSPVGWLYETESDVIEAATKTAIPTHGSPEGIRGARAIALAVFLTRKGFAKDEVKKRIETDFYYDVDEPIESVRKWYKFDVSCQMSVPVAIRAYLESKNFEDAVRLAVSAGGDSDTIGAMTGAIAEAAYGVPEDIARKVIARMGDDVAAVYEDFQQRVG